MANYDAKQIRNVAILGHQSSGKTSLVLFVQIAQILRRERMVLGDNFVAGTVVTNRVAKRDVEV